MKIEQGGTTTISSVDLEASSNINTNQGINETATNHKNLDHGRKQKEQQQWQQATKKPSTTASTNSSPEATNKQPQQRKSQQQEQHPQISQKVAMQSFLYVSAFFASFIFSLILVIVSSIDPEGVQSGKYFGIQVLETLFYPLQGFFNFLVYTRAKRCAWRNIELKASIFWIYKQIITGAPVVQRRHRSNLAGGLVVSRSTTGSSRCGPRDGVGEGGGSGRGARRRPARRGALHLGGGEVLEGLLGDGEGAVHQGGAPGRVMI